MLNYAFVNLSSKLSCISDNNFAFRGTWASGSSYAPPVDVVDYNNGKFIVLVANSATPPLNSSKWSELVLRGTISPTDPFAIAQTALTTANAASVLALASSGTANQALEAAREARLISQTGTNLANSAYALAVSGTNLAREALAIAVAGTNLAQAAYDIATSGTVAGTNISISSGTDLIFIAGLNLGYTPSAVNCTVETPNLSGLNLFPTLVGRPTANGFVVRLNGTTDESGYFLHWMARK